MKIIHVIPSLWNGGAEKFTVELCNKLSKQNDVILCSFKDIEGGMFFVKDINNSVKLVTLHKNNTSKIRFFYRYTKFIIQQKPDIVNTHLSAFLYTTPLIIFFRSARYFHTLHSVASNEEKNKYIRLIKKIFFKWRLIKPITLSQYNDLSFKELYGNIPSTIINNGISTPKTSDKLSDVECEIKGLIKNEHTKVFISVGSIIKVKNHQLLIEVFNRLLVDKENAILLIIGSPSNNEKDYYNSLLRKKSSNTFFLGAKSNVSDYLTFSDVFCMPSLFEGMPMSLLEAYSKGLPALCTPVGGIPDILKDGENGFLSKDTSYEEFYHIVKKYFSLTAFEIERIRTNNLSDFKRLYSIDITAHRYYEIYNS